MAKYLKKILLRAKVPAVSLVDVSTDLIDNNCCILMVNALFHKDITHWYATVDTMLKWCIQAQSNISDADIICAPVYPAAPVMKSTCEMSGNSTLVSAVSATESRKKGNRELSAILDLRFHSKS